MASKKKYDAVATVGEYTDSYGETKKRYLNVGVVLEGDDGRLYMKLDALPLVKDWSGFINFFEPKAREQSTHTQAKQDGYAPAADLDDEIPF